MLHYGFCTLQTTKIIMLESRTINRRPFLKWPGGKMRIISTLLAHLPERSILVEPFVGAGALFANTHHDAIVINDINTDLINVYKQLKQRKLKFIKAAEKYFSGKYHNASAYYAIREQFNQSNDAFERAYLFLYLNRHGYNGLCRYNQQGAYNVPFGEYKSPYFPRAEMLFFAERLKKAKISNLSYIDCLKKIADSQNLKRTVIYCDPPYVPLSKTANFTGYHAAKFTLDDQEILADLCHYLWKQGAAIMISNHDLPLTRTLYRLAKIKSLLVKRVISCRSDLRQNAEELLAIFA